MKTPFSKGPIFIVGAPRSGTTLLQYMLRSHPALSLPTGESHFCIPLYCNAAQYGDLSEGSNVRRVLEAMEAKSAEFLYTDLHGLKFDIEALTREFVSEGRHAMRDIITGLFEKNASGEGKPRWGDKTPYYVLHIPKLLTWWPDAQVIHIIRDGRDVALSMFSRRHDFHLYNVYLAAIEWGNYVETGRKAGLRLPEEKYLEVRYEDVISDHRIALQKICSFLGESYTDDLLNYKKAGMAGKTPLLQGDIQRQNQGKWRAEMTPWQVRVFESAASATLEKFDYPVMTAGTRLPLPVRAMYRAHHATLSHWYRRFGPKRTPWTPLSPS